MQVSTVNNVVVNDSKPKVPSKSTEGKDKSFSKELNKAVKEKVHNSNNDNSTEGDNKLESKDLSPKEVKGQGEEKKVNADNCVLKEDTKDNNTVENSTQLIFSMFQSITAANSQQLQEQLKPLEGNKLMQGSKTIQDNKAVEGNIEAVLKSIINLNSSTKITDENIDSKIKEMASILGQDDSEIALKDINKIVEKMNLDNIPKEGIEKILENDGIQEQIKKILLSKVDKERVIIPEPRKFRINEVNEKTTTANVTVKDITSLDVKNLQESKDEKILSSLLSQDKEVDKKDALINKAANFTALFSTIKEDKVSVEEPKMVINKDNVVQDIIKTVKFMEVNDLKQLTVKIAPKELGEVIIKLTMENGVMKANITASNKEAYNLLNSNLSDINNKLSNTEIKVQDFNLSLYNGDTTFFKDQNKKHDEWQQNNTKAVSGKFIDEEEAIDSIEENNNNVNIYA